MGEKSNYVKDWARVLGTKTISETRIFKKDDKYMDRPFLNGGISLDFETGEKMITLYSPGNYVKELGTDLTYVMNEETFNKFFEEKEIRIQPARQ